MSPDTAHASPEHLHIAHQSPATKHETHTQRTSAYIHDLFTTAIAHEEARGKHPSHIAFYGHQDLFDLLDKTYISGAEENITLSYLEQHSNYTTQQIQTILSGLGRDPQEASNEQKPSPALLEAYASLGKKYIAPQYIEQKPSTTIIDDHSILPIFQAGWANHLYEKMAPNTNQAYTSASQNK